MSTVLALWQTGSVSTFVTLSITKRMSTFQTLVRIESEATFLTQLLTEHMFSFSTEGETEPVSLAQTGPVSTFLTIVQTIFVSTQQVLLEINIETYAKTTALSLEFLLMSSFKWLHFALDFPNMKSFLQVPKRPDKNKYDYNHYIFQFSHKIEISQLSNPGAAGTDISLNRKLFLSLFKLAKYGRFVLGRRTF